MFLAITLARSGSQRLKNKNIKKINKKTLLDYTFERSIKSKYIDEIFFSSESVRINKIAKKIGYKVIFKRPNRLAKHNVTPIPVLMHAIKIIKKIKKFKYIILLQPTSPLRNKEDIDKSIEIIKKKKFESLISITKSRTKHKLDVIIKKNYLYKNFRSKKKLAQKNFYYVNGAIYISTVSNFLENKSFFSKKTGFYIMDPERSIDIDKKKDFEKFKKKIILSK
tara:strand:+ start:59 stop:727 length:669 start_codon:yes stop_codon:yes gene_type:complete